MQDVHTMARLTRDDLDLALAIAEEGTVTRAAMRLHLSQSALSHRLRALEDRMGGVLFRRGFRGMAATAAGEKLVERARRISAEFRDSEGALAELIHRRKRIVRLATECYTSFHWLPALVRRMARVSRDVELQIVIEATRRWKTALASGETDAVILQSSGVNQRLIYFPLFRDELMLVVGGKHRLATKRTVQPQDLNGEKLVLHQIPSSHHPVVDEFLLPAKVQPGQVVEVQLTEAIIEMVRAGMGVTVLARWLVEPYLRSGGLTILRLGARGLWRDWRLASLRECPLVPDLKRLAEVFASVLPARLKGRTRRD
jgi:LysR family transcriptional regulator, regulator for metE and metH